jgi:hypothetical protein
MRRFLGIALGFLSIATSSQTLVAAEGFMGTVCSSFGGPAHPIYGELYSAPGRLRRHRFDF